MRRAKMEGYINAAFSSSQPGLAKLWTRHSRGLAQVDMFSTCGFSPRFGLGKTPVFKLCEKVGLIYLRLVVKSNDAIFSQLNVGYGK
jgi:hypothetical protein